VELIKLTEKFEFNAYPDPINADGLPVTIGYGCTLNRNRQPWNLGDWIGEAEADPLLKRDVTEAYAPMASIPHWEDMNAYQRAGIADLNYNEGYTYGDGDHDTLDRMLLNRDWEGVGLALQLYDNKDELGLSRRRYAEWLMFNQSKSPEAAYKEAWGMESVKAIMQAVQQ
jgi:lysozyme